MNMTETNGRVIHKEFGTGEIVGEGLFGNEHIAFVRFDSYISESIHVLRGDYL